MSEATVSPMPWQPVITFGTRLRSLRRQYGERVGRRFNQREFATEVLGMANHTTYAAWEADTNVPGHLPVIAREIADRTGVSAAWLMGGEDDGGDSAASGLTLWYPRAA